ncbi:sufE-like protein 2, chloroplastic [Senna tora]|uniref:SufE-like protein 2, chloroplastic n=1 Tax=Senna tora TaxID=362788 RepID=A0A834X6V2_9FABA|nr:sufE-like protein 2, chloroplastic [Senna tora]
MASASASASATLSTIPASSHSSLSVNLSSPKHIELKFRNKNGRNRAALRSFYRNSDHIDSVSGNPSSIAVAEKLRLLVSEFRSLPEPIDRVRRLLDFAALLPPLEESDRVAENRVGGCTAQVWLMAEMDEVGRMRFRADSDSEISKGFCWCLVWMLDGAEAEEVMTMKTEDLVDVNVGLDVKAQSRVNTWQNLLFSMQKATKALVIDMQESHSCFAKVVWFNTHLGYRFHNCHDHNMLDWFRGCPNNLGDIDDHQITFICVVLHVIWRCRNPRIVEVQNANNKHVIQTTNQLAWTTVDSLPSFEVNIICITKMRSANCKIRRVHLLILQGNQLLAEADYGLKQQEDL